MPTKNAFTVPGSWGRDSGTGNGDGTSVANSEAVPRNAAGVVSKSGDVVDETGRAIGALPDPKEAEALAGSAVTATGDVISASGDILGKASLGEGGSGEYTTRPADGGKPAGWNLLGKTKGAIQTVDNIRGPVNKTFELAGRLKDLDAPSAAAAGHKAGEKSSAAGVRGGDEGSAAAGIKGGDEGSAATGVKGGDEGSAATGVKGGDAGRPASSVKGGDEKSAAGTAKREKGSAAGTDTQSKDTQSKPADASEPESVASTADTRDKRPSCIQLQDNDGSTTDQGTARCDKPASAATASKHDERRAASAVGGKAGSEKSGAAAPRAAGDESLAAMSPVPMDEASESGVCSEPLKPADSVSAAGPEDTPSERLAPESVARDSAAGKTASELTAGKTVSELAPDKKTAGETVSELAPETKTAGAAASAASLKHAPSEQAADDVTDKAADRAPGLASEQATEKHSEHATQKTASELAPEQTSQKARSELAPEQTSQKAPSELAPEQTSQKPASEAAPGTAAGTATERALSEAAAEPMFDKATPAQSQAARTSADGRSLAGTELKTEERPASTAEPEQPVGEKAGSDVEGGAPETKEDEEKKEDEKEDEAAKEHEEKEDGEVEKEAPLDEEKQDEKEDEEADKEAPPDYSILKGTKVNKAGNLVDDNGDVMGRLVEGDAKQLLGRRADHEGYLWDDAGNRVGRGSPLPEAERRAAKAFAPFENFPDAVVEADGRVVSEGRQVGEVVEGDARRLKGSRVDEDGDILDRRGNVVGRAEAWDEPEPAPEEAPPPPPDRSALAGKRVNKAGNVVDGAGVIYGRVVEGHVASLVGRMCNRDGGVMSEAGDVIGRAELVPEHEREGARDGPFAGLVGCTVTRDGKVATAAGDVVGRLVTGDGRALQGRAVDDDGDVVDRNGNVLARAERWEEPEEERRRGALAGRRVNREGSVADEDGNVIGRLVSGDLSVCAGKEIDDDGDVVNAKGVTVGHVSLLEDIPPEEPEPVEEETETAEEREKREQAETDRKLAAQLAAAIEQSLDRMRPLCRLIVDKIERAERTPKEELDEEQLVREVRPLIEEGGGVLTETNGVIRGLDPDGRIQRAAKSRAGTREATPEEHHLAEVLKELTGTVSETIDKARRLIDGMPHAKKELNPLWGLLSEPLFQILAAVGLLLNGVLGLVGRLLSGLGLGGLLDNLLGGLGLNKVLGSLGLGSALEALTGKKVKK